MKIIGMHADKGFGMPSGHAQSATVWMLAATYANKKNFWILALLVTFFVGFSRIYLGVHFPTQVLFGWLAGILIIICFIRLESVVDKFISGITLYKQLLFSVFCAAIIILLAILLNFRLNFWEMPQEWILNTAGYTDLNHSILKTYGLASVCGNAGGFLGVSMGAILMKWKGGFEIQGSIWKKLLSALTGISALVVLFMVMRLIEPGYDQPCFKALWRFSGFYILAISTIFFVPLLLKRLKLLN